MTLADTFQGHRMVRAYSKGAKLRAKKARRGRPREAGPREPSGKLSRAHAEHVDPVQAVVMRQRVKLVGLDNAGSQLAESALGVLCLLGRLSDGGTNAAEREAANRAAYDAGVWWRGVVHNLHRLIGAPIPYPRSPAWEMVGRGGIRGPTEEDLSEITNPEAREWAERELIRRKQHLLGEYERGRAVMGENALAVEALVIHDRAEQVERAKAGLAALVRLTTARKSDGVRN